MTILDFEQVEPTPVVDPPVRFYGYRDSYWPDGDSPILDVYLLVKETPCGFWIRQEFWSTVTPVWVSKTTRKRKAYPTQAEALTSYLARKEKQVRILTGQLASAQRNLSNAMRLAQPEQKGQV